MANLVDFTMVNTIINSNRLFINALAAIPDLNCNEIQDTDLFSTVEWPYQNGVTEYVYPAVTVELYPLPYSRPLR